MHARSHARTHKHTHTHTHTLTQMCAHTSTLVCAWVLRISRKELHGSIRKQALESFRSVLAGKKAQPGIIVIQVRARTAIWWLTTAKQALQSQDVYPVLRLQHLLLSGLPKNTLVVDNIRHVYIHSELFWTLCFATLILTDLPAFCLITQGGLSFHVYSTDGELTFKQVFMLGGVTRP